MFKNQPGVVLQMKAKPGQGDALFKLTTDLHYLEDPDGPVDWVLARSDQDPDTMWAMEFYKSDESFTRHYTNPVIDGRHEDVIALLAEMPQRIDLHTVSFGIQPTDA
jgi:quinol monooxygenase YgiN